jgi:hypothetical protein
MTTDDADPVQAAIEAAGDLSKSEKHEMLAAYFRILERRPVARRRRLKLV